MYLGIDNGGSSVKAILFDKTGRQILQASEELTMITPQSGHTERDMEALWQANIRVIRQITSRVDPQSIKGAAITGHGKGLYLWGKDNKPATNGIYSADSRAWAYPQKWAKDGTADKAFIKTYQSLLASQPVSLLCWIRDNQPQIYKNIHWIFECKDYIRFRLTGEAYAELTDISGSSLLNLETRTYDKELLSLYGLEDIYEALPPLRRSSDICGKITAQTAKLTGLPEGLTIAGGMFDIDACAIAMDITNDENIAVIAGTWSINEYIAKNPVLDKSIMMNSLYCMDDYYLIEECSPTSMGNLAWIMENVMPDIPSYPAFIEMAETVALDEQQLVFLPFIFGSNYNPLAKAVLLGMDSHNTRNHIARAILEGICFCHKVHVDKLLANRESTKAIRLAGGAAQSRFCAQLFADILEMPVELMATDELGTLGAAMAAAVAAGEYANFKEAAKAMVNIKSRVEPQVENFPIYREKYTRYRQAADALEKFPS